TTNVSLANSTTLTGAVNRNQLSGASGINTNETIPGNLVKNVNVNIDSSSVWNVTGSSTVSTLKVANGALVNFAHSSPTGPFMTLFVDKLTGTGGNFNMQVDLGAIKGVAIVVGTSSQGQHLLDLAARDPNADLPANTG